LRSFQGGIPCREKKGKEGWCSLAMDPIELQKEKEKKGKPFQKPGTVKCRGEKEKKTQASKVQKQFLKGRGAKTQDASVKQAKESDSFLGRGREG